MLHEGMTMMTINANASEMVTGRSASTRLHLMRLGNCGVRAVAAVVGLLAISELAWAADLSPAPAVASAPYNWTGLYVGANVGYASARVTETVSGGGGTASANLPGGIGGFQIGANGQFGAVVLGFEADFDGNMATKSVIGNGILSGTAQIPWIGTLRGRVGYAFDRFLLYATAGGAATQLVSTVNVAGIGSASTSFMHGAWTAGGGLEAAVTKNLSARVEYLYLETANFNVAQVGPPFATVTGRLQDNLVRVGVNYRLPVAW
jgi:outer membrane immunogenic protein